MRSNGSKNWPVGSNNKNRGESSGCGHSHPCVKHMYQSLTRISIALSALFFLLPGKSHAAVGWTAWSDPTVFAGLNYESSQWSNPTNIAGGGVDDGIYATVDVQFSIPPTPAPQIFYRSLQFTEPVVADITGNKVNQVEVQVRYRRRYNVNPDEEITLYWVQPDGDVINAINTPNSVYVKAITSTSWVTTTFYWRDESTTDITKMKVGDEFNPFVHNQASLVIGLQKKGTSGTTNFVDIDTVRARFYVASGDFPVNVSKTQQAMDDLQGILLTKAPFAYIDPIININWEGISTQPAQLVLNIPMNGEIVPLTTTIERTEMTERLRGLSKFAIYGLLIFYLVTLMGRIV